MKPKVLIIIAVSVVALGAAGFFMWRFFRPEAATKLPTDSYPATQTITSALTITNSKYTVSTVNGPVTYHLDNTDLTIKGGFTLTLAGDNKFKSLFVDAATITHENLIPTTDFDPTTNALTASGQTKKVSITTTGDITLKSGGKINVDAKGYSGGTYGGAGCGGSVTGYGPGKGLSVTDGGHTVDAGGAGYFSNGGSARKMTGSGLSSQLTEIADSAGKAYYKADSFEPGSGGGSAVSDCDCKVVGGAGGGRVKIISGGKLNIQPTSSISANGANGGWSDGNGGHSRGGGGSGGIISLSVNSLSYEPVANATSVASASGKATNGGDGKITNTLGGELFSLFANGGNGGSADHTEGGGGSGGVILVSKNIDEPLTCKTVAVYSLADYGGMGAAACLSAGNYNTQYLTSADLAGTGTGKDPISSIKVSAGYTATLYNTDNYIGGQYQVLTAKDYPNLNIPITGGTGTWDNKILSIRVAPILSCDTVSIYSEPDYGPGTRACLPVGKYTTAQITAAGIGSDPISSIKVATNYTATVYAADNFTGATQALITDYRRLDIPIPGGTGNWADNIKSIEVSTGTTPTTPKVTLTANDKESLTVTVGESYTIKWAITGSNMSLTNCTALPERGWFLEAKALTGSGVEKIDPNPATVTYKLTCWPTTGTEAANSVSDQVVVAAVAASTCPAPTSETRVQSCPTGQTGSINQTRTKGAAPTCAWGDWADTTNTCTTTTTTTPPTTTTTTTTTGSTTGTTNTTRSATTGPETPLVATGLLTLTLGAFYLVKRYLG